MVSKAVVICVGVVNGVVGLIVVTTTDVLAVGVVVDVVVLVDVVDGLGV